MFRTQVDLPCQSDPENIANSIAIQKSLRIRISNVQNTPGTDCDGAISGDSDWEWQFNTTGADPCIEADNNSANNYNPNVTLLGTNYYYSRNCWPTGSFNIGFRAFEDDGTGNCDGECSIGYTYNSRAYRAYNSFGTYTDWSNISRSTSCNCPTTITYRYSAQQIVGGTFSGNNLNASSYVNNTTCATARNLGSGTYLGASGSYVTQCTDTWYYYDLTSDRNTFRVNPSQNGSYVTIYYSATSSCSDLCYRAGGNGEATVQGAEAGRYYIRLGSSGGGNTNMAINTSGTSRDQITFAQTVTPNFSSTVNNSSYSEQTGEPNPAGDIYNTWWYKIVTPPGGYAFLQASISSQIEASMVITKLVSSEHSSVTEYT